MRHQTARRRAGVAAFLAAVTVPGLSVAQRDDAPPLVPAPTVSAPAVSVPADVGPAEASQNPQVAALLKLIADTLAAAPPGSRAQDIEALLSFAIDQAQTDCTSSRAALAAFATRTDLPRAASAALRNIRDVLSRCENSGTAALAAARAVIDQGSSLTLGGGSANYIRP